MNRLLLFLIIAVYVVSCTPKLGTKGDTGEYIEDVSAYRPKVDLEAPTISDDNQITTLFT